MRQDSVSFTNHESNISCKLECKGRKYRIDLTAECSYGSLGCVCIHESWLFVSINFEHVKYKCVTSQRTTTTINIILERRWIVDWTVVQMNHLLFVENRFYLSFILRIGWYTAVIYEPATLYNKSVLSISTSIYYLGILKYLALRPNDYCSVYSLYSFVVLFFEVWPLPLKLYLNIQLQCTAWVDVNMNVLVYSSYK